MPWWSNFYLGAVLFDVLNGCSRRTVAEQKKIKKRSDGGGGKKKHARRVNTPDSRQLRSPKHHIFQTEQRSPRFIYVFLSWLKNELGSNHAGGVVNASPEAGNANCWNISTSNHSGEDCSLWAGQAKRSPQKRRTLKKRVWNSAPTPCFLPLNTAALLRSRLMTHSAAPPETGLEFSVNLSTNNEVLSC